jgi:hypothetical protein
MVDGDFRYAFDHHFHARRWWPFSPPGMRLYRFLLARRVGGGDGAAFLAFVLIRSSRHCVCDGQIDGKTAGRPAARVQLVLRARTAMEADLALGFPLAVPSFIGQSPYAKNRYA